MRLNVKFFFTCVLINVATAFVGSELATASPDGVNAEEGIIIGDTQPALTKDMLNNARRFTEWALGVEFTDLQCSTFDQKLIRVWKTHDQEGMAGTVLMSRMFVDLRTLPEAHRRELQLDFRSHIVEALYNHQDDPDDVWLLQAYNATRGCFICPKIIPQRGSGERVAEFVAKYKSTDGSFAELAERHSIEQRTYRSINNNVLKMK